MQLRLPKGDFSVDRSRETIKWQGGLWLNTVGLSHTQLTPRRRNGERCVCRTRASHSLCGPQARLIRRASRRRHCSHSDVRRARRRPTGEPHLTVRPLTARTQNAADAPPTTAAVDTAVVYTTSIFTSFSKGAWRPAGCALVGSRARSAADELRVLEWKAHVERVVPDIRLLLDAPQLRQVACYAANHEPPADPQTARRPRAGERS